MHSRGREPDWGLLLEIFPHRRLEGRADSGRGPAACGPEQGRVCVGSGKRLLLH